MVHFTHNCTCPHIIHPYPFEHFAPTLAQCFLIVITGYLVAKFHLLSASDLRGVVAFVSYIGMPGIICMTLADADFGDLHWELLAGLFLGKCLIFILVAGISLRVNGNIGIAGVLGLFCVHCNDLPVGNPIMSAAYENRRPQMMKYLFFMPAMTMAFFVPIGTFMIDVHKARRSRIENGSPDNQEVSLKWTKVITLKEIYLISQSVLKAFPVIAATLLGIILNFSFKSNMPAFLHQPFKVVASTVPGMVLCILGFSLVRKERYLMSSSIIIAIVLIFVKMLITPIINYSITKLLTEGHQSSKMLSDFALLYGIVSPATAVFQAGHEYRKPLAEMSATLVLSSFLSFPASYVIARFTLFETCKMSHYLPVLQEVIFSVACFSLLCNAYVLFSILWNKKWKKVPYRYVMCLMVTQIFIASGIVLWKLSDEHKLQYVYFQMVLYYGGEISCFIWLGILSLLLISAERYPALAKNGFSMISSTVFAVCTVITSVMCTLILVNDVKKVYVIGRARSNFEFLQLAANTILLAFCAFVVGVCLLQHFRRKHAAPKKLYSDVYVETGFVDKNSNKYGFDNPIFYMDTEDVTATRFKRKRTESTLTGPNKKDEADLYYQEMLLHNGGIEKESKGGREWTFRLCSLLVLQLVTMSVKLLSNSYKLVHSRALEIMIPLEFLQSILFVGQGFFVFITFGIDARTISIQMTRWWRKIRYGREEFIPNVSSVEPESDIDIFCNRFNNFYITKCFKKLAKDRKWKDSFYKDCFWGHQLVDWMIQERLAMDDVESEELGQQLLLGGVISHVTGAHHFHDAPYLYYFSKRQVNRVTDASNDVEFHEEIINVG